MTASSRRNASYRVQLTPTFGFRAAAALLDHLRLLGIDTLYVSPIFEARPGSEHGYDVTDPTRVRAELGGNEAFDELLDAVARQDMTVLLDIVPNHMASDEHNPWWWDVLKRGPSSRHAAVFDINWRAAGGQIILPVLGRTLDDVLADGQLRLTRGSPHDHDELVLAYFDRRFPVGGTVDDLFDPAAVAPGRHLTDAATLRAVIDRQHYELRYWQRGLRRLNYRRFFDISDLVSIRVEEPAVFDQTHALIRDLIHRPQVSGLRVDHVDGLRSPGAYLRRLRSAMPAGKRLLVEKILGPGETLPADWPVDGTTGYVFANAVNDLFVEPGGYRALRDAALQRSVMPADFDELSRQARREVCIDLFPAEFHRLAETLQQVTKALAASGGDGAAPDPSLNDCHDAMIELTIGLDVYRTYTAGRDASADDARRIEVAAEEALSRADRAGVRRAIATLREVLLGRVEEALRDEPARGAAAILPVRWQQMTGPVMAKGVEDTALYRHAVLMSMNEVGGGPHVPDEAVESFHRFNASRQQHWPRAMNATATHDTKRGEDTRARIDVLSELHEAWLTRFNRWMTRHASLRTNTDDGPSPSAADEVIFYQSLLGIWPADLDHPAPLTERLREYMTKAAREAKVRTDWHEPNEAYEQGLAKFVETLLTGEAGASFRNEARALRDHIALAGAWNALTQTLLKITSPGTPDFYQGTEQWDLVLVDPDNRRPVPYDALRAMRRSAEGVTSAEDFASLRAGWTDGRIKTLVTMRALAVRRAQPDVFEDGSYVPLRAMGEQAESVVTFARRHEDDWVLAVAPRLVARFTSAGQWPVGGDFWGNTAIALPDAAPDRWYERLTGRTVSGHRALPLADACEHLPVALLTPQRQAGPAR